MSRMKRFIFLSIFASLLIFTTSCLNGEGNYQTYAGVTGSIYTYQGVKYMIADSIFQMSKRFYSSDFQSMKDSDRVVAWFKIDYDHQPNSNYYTLTELQSITFPLQKVREIQNNEADTIYSDDPIVDVNNPLLSRQGNGIYLTINSLYKASNSNFQPVLIYNQAQQSIGDTLKLDYRLDKNGDTGSTTNYNYTSFDLTKILKTMSPSVIRIKYNISSISYTYVFSNPFK